MLIDLKHTTIAFKSLWQVRDDQTDKSQVTDSHYAKFGFDLYMIYDFIYSLITDFRRKAQVYEIICWCLPCLLTLDRVGIPRLLP